MTAIDTNVILRLMLRDVPSHTSAAEQFIAAQSPSSIQVADAAFFEVVWILSGPSQGYSRATIGEGLLQFIQTPQLNCNRKLIERAVPLYIAHPKLSFIDVCLTVYAELDKATPLLTFDKQLAKTLPGTRLLT